MYKFSTVILSVLALTGCSQKPVPELPSTVSQYQGLEDIDYQITITKQAIERYKSQVYMIDEQAEAVMSRDFMGYRDDEVEGRQAQEMVESLQQRLQQLEEQRALLIKKQSGTKAVPAKK